MINKELHQNLISIILPAYNTREDFLRDAIESVIAQTYQNWELLIIDDSTTAPVEMIAKMLCITGSWHWGIFALCSEYKTVEFSSKKWTATGAEVFVNMKQHCSRVCRI